MQFGFSSVRLVFLVGLLGLGIAGSAAAEPIDPCFSDGGPTRVFPPVDQSRMPRDGWIIVRGTQVSFCAFGLASQEDFSDVAMTASTWPGGFLGLKPNEALQPGLHDFSLAWDTDAIEVLDEDATVLTATPTLTLRRVAFHPDQEGEDEVYFELDADVSVPEPEATSILQLRTTPPEASIDDDDGTIGTALVDGPAVTINGVLRSGYTGGPLCVVLNSRDYAGGYGPSVEQCTVPTADAAVDYRTAGGDDADGGCQAVSGSDASFLLLLLLGFWLLAKRRHIMAKTGGS